MTHHDDTNDGPLQLLPAPPDTATRRVLAEKLRGHATSATWLPEGLSDELDELRSEHLRVRQQVIAERQAVAALDARWKAEDAAYEERLRQAHREGRGSVEDQRTPVEEREREHARAIERYWAGVRVLAERVDAVVAYFHEHEPDLLAQLRSRREPLTEAKREAQRIAQQAEVAEWGLAQLGRWVQQTTDGVFGPQPAPVASAPPSTFNAQMLDRALERPWFRQPEVEEQPVAWLDQEPERPDVEPVDTEDETGVVSEIVENEGATS